MGEEVHREHALEDGGDLVRLNEQMVVEKTAVVAIVLVEEAKGHSCTRCPRVFSTGRALGGHMSSVHGPLKKFDSSSKKLKSVKRIANQKNFEIGEFTCKYCGMGFTSVKAVHGHMKVHPGRNRRGTKPPTELVIENPVKYSLEPEILADGFDSEDHLIAPIIEEDFIKNLRERTVTGRRGRGGTKPHKVDSPEIILEKKKALLSGDPQELRKIMDHHDDSGYFRRAFGKFLDFPGPEIEVTKDIQGDFEMGNSEISENSATTSSYFCSNCPLVCSEKFIIADSISKDIYKTSMESLDMDESKNVEDGKPLEGTTSIENRLTGKKRKLTDSNFAENKIIKKMKIDHSHTAQGSDEHTPMPDLS